MITRRSLLQAGTGVAIGSALLAAPVRRSQAQAQLFYTPEDGARLRLLRWEPFVEGEGKAWMANTRKFSDATGVEVEVESIPWPAVSQRGMEIAQAGSGPDIVLGWFDDPHRFPDKLLDLSLLAVYLGGRYGGWYPVCERYGTRVGQWIGLPLGSSGTAMVYRDSHMREAGFDAFPEDTDGFLELCRALAGKGTPPGFALGHAVGDANTWTRWLLWGFGGKLADASNNVVIDSNQTWQALQFARELYQTFIPGTETWLDADNNKAFLAGEISLTNNGVSIYASAKDDPALAELLADIRHARMPVGPVGEATELHLLSQAMVFAHTPYPNAALEYLRFMWEREQYEPWQLEASGYVTQPLEGYEDNSVWGADPAFQAYKDATARMLWNGYAGELGAASAAAMADYIVVDMFADAATGRLSPREAAARAEERALVYYRAYLP
ncbi:MAG TPA: extracellular solute-binding protein [Geminicoccaceae bacterium]